MSHYGADEWRERLAAMMASHVHRKRLRRARREAFRAAREYGLAARHARKLARDVAPQRAEAQEGIEQERRGEA